MRKVKVSSQEPLVKQRPSMSPEGREQQMISYAIDLAERQLIEGTASSQVITHYLKLASSKEKLEQEKLELEKQLLEAKTEALQSAKRSEELYEKAMKSMMVYAGRTDIDEDIFRDVRI